MLKQIQQLQLFFSEKFVFLPQNLWRIMNIHHSPFTVIADLTRNLHYPFSILSILIFSFFPSFAQQPIIDIDENAQNRIMTAAVKPCDFNGITNNKTSIIHNYYQIPSYELYENQWDTIFIRSKKLNIPFFDNQLKIILVQEGNTPFAFPISSVVSTGFIKIKGKQHAGIDFTVKKIEPVVSCFDGVVRIAKKYEEYGNTVVIRHYNGLETLYALLDNVCVQSGQKVNAGELIGYVGTLNSDKKNMLHFETRFFNEFFNPEKMIHFSDRKLQNNILTFTPNDFINIPIIDANPSVIQEDTESKPQSSPPQSPKYSKPNPQYHTVQKGENIYRICLKYDITEEELRTLNHIKDNNIVVGQKLRVK